MLIVLGSVRPAKVDGARAAIASIATIDDRFQSAALRTMAVGDTAPVMPMSETDIIAGARARAAAALASAADVAGPRFGAGLEGGLHPVTVDGACEWALCSWAAVTDGTSWGYGGGGNVIVPRPIAEEVLAGRELGDVIDRIAGEGTRSTRGAWGVLTRDLISRSDAFRVALIAAFAPFYRSSVFSLRSAGTHAKADTTSDLSP
jgi:inosine/xanthosine triphosphatase